MAFYLSLVLLLLSSTGVYSAHNKRTREKYSRLVNELDLLMFNHLAAREVLTMAITARRSPTDRRARRRTTPFHQPTHNRA
jgi:hypothetical protein